jgi:hypothetical protein
MCLNLLTSTNKQSSVVVLALHLYHMPYALGACLTLTR